MVVYVPTGNVREALWPPRGRALKLQREDLRLICFDYLCS